MVINEARRVLAALLRIGWAVKRQASSHKVLSREGWTDTVFAFHDGEEIGPRMLSRLAKHTGPAPKTCRGWSCAPRYNMQLLLTRAIQKRAARTFYEVPSQQSPSLG
jgi:predicted RNA binding protein YcfA (HicA-like mRNA interferase family)